MCRVLKEYIDDIVIYRYLAFPWPSWSSGLLFLGIFKIQGICIKSTDASCMKNSIKREILYVFHAIDTCFIVVHNPLHVKYHRLGRRPLENFIIWIKYFLMICLYLFIIPTAVLWVCFKSSFLFLLDTVLKQFMVFYFVDRFAME